MHTASDLRLISPPTEEEIQEWEAAVLLSQQDFYRIAASARLGVLPTEVSIEQRSLMKVTFITSAYEQNTVFGV